MAGILDTWSMWPPGRLDNLASPLTFGQMGQSGLLGGGTNPQVAQAQPASNFNFGSGNPLWMTLLGAGAGLAGGQNWQEGLGKGLGGALTGLSAARKQETEAQDRALKLLMLQNQLRHEGVMETQGQQRIGQQERAQARLENADTRTEQSDLAVLKSSSDQWKNMADTLSKDWGMGTALGGAIGLPSDVADAQGAAKVQAEAILGRKLGDEEAKNFVPQYNDSIQEKYRKLDFLGSGASQKLGSLIAQRGEATQKGFKPVLDSFNYRPSALTPAPGPGGQPQQAGAANSLGGATIPPGLAGKNLQFSKTMNLFRDKDTGALFNINGEPVSGQ